MNDIRGLLVEDNPIEARLVLGLVADTGPSRVELDHVASLGAALERLRAGSYDIILLDLALPDSVGVDTVASVHRAAPGVPILVTTGSDDESLAVQAVSNGAHDYLVKGLFDSATLVRTMRMAIARQGKTAAAQPGPAAGKVVALLGAKGGCGATTIACHLAVEIGARSHSKTLLADLNTAAAAVRFLMKAECAYSMADAAGALTRLDRSCWQGLVSNTRPNLDVIAAPGTSLPVLKADDVARVVQIARAWYAWIVLDLGIWRSEWLPVFDACDQMLLVATPDVLSMYRAKAVLSEIDEAGWPRGNLTLALNRVSRASELDRGDVEKILGLPVSAVLADAPEDIAASYGRGTLAEPAARFGRDIESLARKLTGVEAAAGRSKRLFGKLW